MVDNHISLETLGTDPAGVWHRHFDFNALNDAIDALGHEGICKAIMSMCDATADEIEKYAFNAAASYRMAMSIVTAAAATIRPLSSSETRVITECISAIDASEPGVQYPGVINSLQHASETLEYQLEYPGSILRVSIANMAWWSAFAILPLCESYRSTGQSPKTLDTEISGIRFAYNTPDRPDWNSDDGYDHWTFSFAMKHVMAHVK